MVWILLDVAALLLGGTTNCRYGLADTVVTGAFPVVTPVAGTGALAFCGCAGGGVGLAVDVDFDFEGEGADLRFGGCGATGG